MKKIWFALTLGALAAALAACGAERPQGAAEPPAVEEPATEQPAQEEPAAGETAQEQPAQKPAAEQPAEALESDIAERIQGEMSIGLSTDDVKALYGEPQAVADDSNYLIWRYDFAAEGYTYGEKVVSLDTQGFAEGDMLAQLTVEFGDDTTADAYSVYDMKDGELMQYRVTKNGAAEYPAAAD